MSRSVPNPPKAHPGIKILDFNPVDERTERTCRKESIGKPKRVTKGMIGTIVELYAFLPFIDQNTSDAPLGCRLGSHLGRNYGSF